MYLLQKISKGIYKETNEIYYFNNCELLSRLFDSFLV